MKKGKVRVYQEFKTNSQFSHLYARTLLNWEIFEINENLSRLQTHTGEVLKTTDNDTL